MEQAILSEVAHLERQYALYYRLGEFTTARWLLNYAETARARLEAAGQLRDPDLYDEELDRITMYLAQVRFGDNRCEGPVVPVMPLSGGPATPTGLQVSQGMLVTWGPAGNATVGFRLYRSLSAWGPYTLVRSFTRDEASWTDTTAVPGTLYHYRVSALGNGGLESAWTAPVDGVGLLPAGGLQATWDGAVANLSWALPDQVSDGTEIWRDSGGGWELAGTFPGTSAGLPVAAGAVHRFRARPVYDGRFTAPWTEAVEMVAWDPPAPVLLSVVPLGTDRFLVGWDVPGPYEEVAFEVLNGAWSPAGAFAQGPSEITVEGLPPGTAVSFRATATGGGFVSPVSNVLTVSGLPLSPAVDSIEHLPVPGPGAAAPFPAPFVRISFTPLAGADGHTVWRSGEDDFSTAVALGPSTGTFDDTGLDFGPAFQDTVAYYWVTATVGGLQTPALEGAPTGTLSPATGISHNGVYDRSVPSLRIELLDQRAQAGEVAAVHVSDDGSTWSFLSNAPAEGGLYVPYVPNQVRFIGTRNLSPGGSSGYALSGRVQVPAAPGGLAVTRTVGGAEVSWTDTAPGAHTSVEVLTDEFGGFSVTAILPAGTVSWADNLATEASRDYQVRFVNELDGMRFVSDMATVGLAGLELLPPVLTPSAGATGTVTISYTDPNVHEAGYELQYSPAPAFTDAFTDAFLKSFDWRPFGALHSGGTVDVTGLVSGLTYVFRMRGALGAQRGDWSATAIFTAP